MSLTDFRAYIESRTREAEVRSFQRTFGMFGDIERRTFTHAATMRKAGTEASGRNDGSIQIKGHAAVFGSPSVEMRSHLGIFTEYIDKNAFDKVLRSNPDTILDWDHDTRWPLARVANGSLELSVDETGLAYWARTVPTSYAQDLVLLMEGGYLDQSSFLFRIAPGGEEWRVIENDEGDEIVERTIYEVEGLYDVCVCVAGAYPTTDSGVARTLAYEYATASGYLNKRKYRAKRADDKATTWDVIAPEFRAIGDVSWGPEEGFEDLMCDLECQLNEQTLDPFQFSVMDIAISLNKALVLDWDEYTFWVVPFTIEADEPVASDPSQWVQVESAWVTTAEGYSRTAQSAISRREARMAEPTTEATEPVVAPAEAEAASEEVVAQEVTPEVAPEATPTDADVEAEAEVARAAEVEAEARVAREAALEEARALLARFKA